MTVVVEQVQTKTQVTRTGYEWILYLLESWFLRRLLSFPTGFSLDNKPFRFFAVELNRPLYLVLDTLAFDTPY